MLDNVMLLAAQACSTSCQSIRVKYCGEGPPCKDGSKGFHFLVNNYCRGGRSIRKKEFSVLSSCAPSKSVLKSLCGRSRNMILMAWWVLALSVHKAVG